MSAATINNTTDSGDINGIPTGMDTAAVSYFENRGVRVQFSIGGQTYTSDWDTALATNPTALGTNAGNAAKQFNVGFEIDYENNKNPNLTELPKNPLLRKEVNTIPKAGILEIAPAQQQLIWAGMVDFG